MKKLIALSTLAVGLMLASNQQASAWCNVKFGAGVNLNWQSGDNNLLWGAFRSGQVPPPAGYGGGFPGGYPGVMPQGGGVPMYYEPTSTGGDANGTAAPKQAAAAPAHASNVSQVSYPNNGYGYYQPVSYYPNYNYQTPAYTPNYYQYQVPSYWYGQ